MSAPVLDAARVSLRPLTMADLAWMHTFNTLPGVRLYLFDDEIWSEDDLRTRLMERNAALWDAEGLGLFVVHRKDDASHIGWCGFWYFHEPPVLEVCYAIDPALWGHGYAQEAMEALLRWGAHSRGLDQFVASVDEPNARSHRLLTRLGFRETHRSMGNRYPLRHYVRGSEGLGPVA